MKRSVLLFAFILSAAICAAQPSFIKWDYEVRQLDSENARVVFTGTMEEGYHTYSIAPGNSRTDIISVKTKDCTLNGALGEEAEFVQEKGKMCCYKEIKLIQDITLSGRHPFYSGTIACFVCAGDLCKPESWSFAIKLKEEPSEAKVDVNATGKASGKSLRKRISEWFH